VRRISEKYRRRLADIARICAACGGNRSAAERRVRAELGLASFKADYLRAWEANAEWQAAVEEAGIAAAESEVAAPEKRSPRDLAWLQRMLDEMKQLADDDTADEKARDKARKAALDLLEEIRAGEKHIADLKDRAAKRDFARFLRNLMLWIKANHPRQADVVTPVFRGALRSLGAIVDGERA